MVVNVYEQYFRAEGTFGGVKRRGALVMLISDSEAGNIKYEYAVTFFRHEDDEDFAVSYDAYFSSVAYEGKGRRSKKREVGLMLELQAAVDELAAEAGGKVFWDKPLREARRG